MIKLIDFRAERCWPCRMMLPLVDKLAEEFPSVTIEKINVDQNSDKAREYQIMSIPTIVFEKDWVEVNRLKWAFPYEQLKEALSSL